MSNTTNPLKEYVQIKELPEVGKLDGFINDLVHNTHNEPVVILQKLFWSAIDAIQKVYASKESNTDCSLSFLDCLKENYEASKAGAKKYYASQYEKIQYEALVQEYEDLIAIYKSKYLPANTDCSVEQASEDYAKRNCRSCNSNAFIPCICNPLERAFLAGAKLKNNGLIEALKKIAAKKHKDRSCSLPAQGFNELETAVIEAEDYLACIAEAALKNYNDKL